MAPSRTDCYGRYKIYFSSAQARRRGSMNASDGTLDDGLPVAQVDSGHALRAGGKGSSPDDRINLAREAPVRLGPLAIKPALRRVAHDDGREEILEPRVMQVLVALIRAGGQIVSRDDLMMSCWHGVVVGEDAINRVMGRVRRLAGGLGGGEIKLETITKVGYRLVVSVETGRSVARPAPAPTKLSICVLPFANMSDDPQQAYFSDGISEDIITDLAKVSALSVVARSTAFNFKGKAVDVPEVARQLGVSHVLEGSVRKAGGRVRITAQLIDGAEGDHLWSERWDRDLTDIFALQDEIAQAVVGALKLKLLPDEKQSIERRGTDSADAYNLYLMARQHWFAGVNRGLRRTEEIVLLCRRATEMDPNYARAWALLALAQLYLQVDHDRAEDGAAAAERALALDASLAEAHAVKARYLQSQGQHAEAIVEIDIALSLDPASPEVNIHAGKLSFLQRRPADVIRYFETAAALMETDFDSAATLVGAYAAIGDEEGLRRSARLTLTRVEKAIEQDQNNGPAIATGAYALTALGEAERAEEWIARALLADPDNFAMRFNFACGVNKHLKDPDKSLDLLSPLFATISRGFLTEVLADPDLDSVHEHPRFQAMLAAAEARLAGPAPSK